MIGVVLNSAGVTTPLYFDPAQSLSENRMAGIPACHRGRPLAARSRIQRGSRVQGSLSMAFSSAAERVGGRQTVPAHR